MKKRIVAGIMSAILVVTPCLSISAESDELTETQKNSISMLNYLAVLTQEINESKNSRLYLEDAYSSLISNTYPNAVDSRTQSQLSSLLDTLDNYRMNSVKRDRLEYLYEQNQAQALKAAIPNPVALLSATESQSLPKIIGSVVYMAVDSATSYQAATAAASMDYLQKGWALDDDEAETLHESRKQAFVYMLDIVRDYTLPGDLALSEDAVSDYVHWKNHSNLYQKIQFFESNKRKYEAYGDYWLTLASAYYQNGDYQKCIDCIDTYGDASSRIFRIDRELAKALPLAIVSAEEVLKEDEAVNRIDKWLDMLLANTDEEDWALRYFAAQVYLDLYGKTEDDSYLKESYNIILDNVNYLIDKQREKNAEFLADIEKIETPKGATKAEKNEIKEINSMLKEERERALPPVYEPFIINCDFLFDLIKELEVPQADRKRINGILHPNDEPVFMIDVLDSKYWISTDEDDYSYGVDLLNQSFSTDFDGDDLEIPVFMASDDVIITMTTEDGTVLDDWEIAKVERKDKEDYTTFTATFHSDDAEDQRYKMGDRVHFEVIPKEGLADKMYQYDMEVTDISRSPVRIPPLTTFIDDITFEVVQE